MSRFDLSLKDIEAAAAHIYDVALKTRLEKSLSASKEVGSEVYLKFENEQRTGSFKIRGALNRVRNMTAEEKAKGIVASSAGNHAQGIALAATSNNVSSKVVMPVTSPVIKQIATRSYGAEVVLHGEIYDEAFEHAKVLEEQEGRVFVPPFEDPYIIAGQGTLGLELFEGCPDLDSVVIPIGGGGLISGTALALKTLNPKIKIYGVVAENAPAMKHLFKQTTPDITPSMMTIAEGISVKKPSPIIYDNFISKYVDDIISINEDEISAAIVFLLERAKTVAEGSAAISLAGIMKGQLDLGKKTCALICGGNIDMNLIAKIIDKGLTQRGRLVRLSVLASDRPGALLSITEVIAKLGANVLEVKHDRLSMDLHPKQTRIEFLLETEDDTQIHKIQAEIHKRGIKTEIYQ